MRAGPYMTAMTRTAPPPYPWLDRAGRLSLLKLAVFCALFAPGLHIAVAWSLDALGAKPLTEALHRTGDWAVRFLLLSLAVTPLRRIGNWPKLILVRRMLGLAALAYALVHLTLYVVDQKYDLARVVSEIALRIYLTIGFCALLGLAVLGATSTDRAIRRLGGRWQSLHRIVYGIAVLALVHFFLQSKVDVTQAVLMTGFFVLLMLYRAMHRAGVPTAPVPLFGLAFASAVATALIEAGWYGLKTGVSPWPVLQANLDFEYSIRPAWWVLAVGIGLAALNVWRGARDKAGRRAGRRSGREAAPAAQPS